MEVKRDRREYGKTWRKNNPEKYKQQIEKGIAKRKKDPNYYAKRREQGLLLNYGITIEDYNNLVVKQGGNCAICGIHKTKLSKPLYVDHCHNTGKVRGLLCQKCNSALGLLNDNADTVLKAHKYLTSFDNVTVIRGV